MLIGHNQNAKSYSSILHSIGSYRALADCSSGIIDFLTILLRIAIYPQPKTSEVHYVAFQWQATSILIQHWSKLIQHWDNIGKKVSFDPDLKIGSVTLTGVGSCDPT